PVEYADFEGIIPAGEYGGGSVVVWDNGTWEPQGDPHQAYRAGALKFVLHGRKLKGGFALVRIRGRDARESGRSWLLIKEKDAEARPGYRVTEEEPLSVVSGRSLEQVAAERDRVWRSNRPAKQETRRRTVARSSARRPAPPGPDPAKAPGARRAPLPGFVAPQLATLVDAAPPGEGWVHEMKLDGYRILARLERGQARLLSRRKNDWTDRFPEVARVVECLPARQALVDGEVAVLQPDGTTSFQALQNLASAGDGQLAYFVFDLLHLDGYDLTRSPLESRKEVLRALVEAAKDTSGTLRYSEHVAGSGPAFFGEACRMGLEGVVCKVRDGAYHSGRSRDWLKVKCLRSQEVVIVGFTPPRG
ncbi:MAG TPA: DNA polymerase ligase N-terminal domain-containing protein, partial [Vicinamibacteria bacterium]|nr:DNA polymerase ligase N-terminal domain-containing protein [Vicinamibacteria bacterium]